MMIFFAFLFFVASLTSIIIGVIGIYRFKDSYTRLHASSLIDTIGVTLALISFIFLQENIMSSFKLFLMIIMVFLLGPVSTHSIAKTIYICFKGKSKNDGIT